MRDRKWKYRNLPCTAGNWCITGTDMSNRSSGVLEWCTSEQDALDMWRQMRQFSQFADLRVSYWKPN